MEGLSSSLRGCNASMAYQMGLGTTQSERLLCSKVLELLLANDSKRKSRCSLPLLNSDMVSVTRVRRGNIVIVACSASLCVRLRAEM